MQRLKLIILFFCGLLLCSARLADATPQDELRNVKKEISKKQSLINKTRKVEATVSGELKVINRNLNSKTAELNKLNRDLGNINKKISRTENEINQVAEEARTKQRQIERRLVSLYKAGEMGALRLFFSAGSFPQLAENVRYMSSILEHDKQAFQEYYKKIEELGQLKKRLQAEAADKAQIKADIASKKREIEAEKNKKSSHLTSVRKDRQAHEASLRTLQANAARLQTMLDRLEAQRRKLAEEQRRKAAAKQKGKTQPELPPVPDRGFATQKGRMQMPVRGQVIETFGKHKHPEFNSYTYSKGLVIAVPSGSNVTSIYAGTVIFAEYFKGYGNMVIVDHGGGYFSLYAHNSAIHRKVGAEVKRGEVIAASGDLDSAKGPALYFEIRYQGKPVDPAAWVR